MGDGAISGASASSSNYVDAHGDDAQAQSFQSYVPPEPSPVGQRAPSLTDEAHYAELRLRDDQAALLGSFDRWSDGFDAARRGDFSAALFHLTYRAPPDIVANIESRERYKAETAGSTVLEQAGLVGASPLSSLAFSLSHAHQSSTKASAAEQMQENLKWAQGGQLLGAVLALGGTAAGAAHARRALDFYGWQRSTPSMQATPRELPSGAAGQSSRANSYPPSERDLSLSLPPASVSLSRTHTPDGPGLRVVSGPPLIELNPGSRMGWLRTPEFDALSFPSHAPGHRFAAAINESQLEVVETEVAAPMAQQEPPLELDPVQDALGVIHLFPGLAEKIVDAKAAGFRIEYSDGSRCDWNRKVVSLNQSLKPRALYRQLNEELYFAGVMTHEISHALDPTPQPNLFSSTREEVVVAGVRMEAVAVFSEIESDPATHGLPTSALSLRYGDKEAAALRQIYDEYLRTGDHPACLQAIAKYIVGAGFIAPEQDNALVSDNYGIKYDKVWEGYRNWYRESPLVNEVFDRELAEIKAAESVLAQPTATLAQRDEALAARSALERNFMPRVGLMSKWFNEEWKELSEQAEDLQWETDLAPHLQRQRHEEILKQFDALEHRAQAAEAPVALKAAEAARAGRAAQETRAAQAAEVVKAARAAREAR